MRSVNREIINKIRLLVVFPDFALPKTFKPNERALVIVSGNYQSCLGVYVFDSQGNCVAKDDTSDPQAADDLVTDWIPAEQARYSIEVRNAGMMPNSFQIAVR